MTNQAQISNTKKIYDLEERTAKFGEFVIDFVKSIKETNTNKSLLNQLVRSGTSIGANYMEADVAESKKDFRHKIAICKKEAKETNHWLRMIARSNPELAKQCRELWQEAHEFVLIFSTIINNAKIS